MPKRSESLAAALAAFIAVAMLGLASCGARRPTKAPAVEAPREAERSAEATQPQPPPSPPEARQPRPLASAKPPAIAVAPEPGEPEERAAVATAPEEPAAALATAPKEPPAPEEPGVTEVAEELPAEAAPKQPPAPQVPQEPPVQAAPEQPPAPQVPQEPPVQAAPEQPVPVQPSPQGPAPMPTEPAATPTEPARTTQAEETMVAAAALPPAAAPAPAAVPEQAPAPAPAAVPEQAAAPPSTAALAPPAKGEALGLRLVAPLDGSFYASSVLIEGNVTGGEAASAGLKSLTFELDSSPPVRGEIPVYKDGTYELEVSTRGLNDTRVLTVRMEAKDGRVDERSVSLLDAKIEPRIDVSEPAEGASYGARLLVKGTVSYPYLRWKGKSGISSATLEVHAPNGAVSEPVSQALQLAEDGSFQAVVASTSLSGPQVLSITVGSAGGGRVERNVGVRQGESPIPSFAAVATDGAVTLSWSPVPLARQHIVYWAVGSKAALEDDGKAVEASGGPPLAVTELQNGVAHTFRLKAVGGPGVEDVWSSPVRAIPLSPQTLAPVLAPDYDLIEVAWTPLPDVSRYEVWRSTDPEEGYQVVSGPVPPASYIDRDVRYGREYFYKVRPAVEGSPLSAAVGGRTTATPANAVALSATIEAADARRIAIAGQYAYVADGKGGIALVDVSDPAKPSVTSRIQTTDARDLVVRAGIAYVADGAQGLRILDVSDPLKPFEIGLRAATSAQGIALQGDRALVADGAKGLKIYDVSDPARPARLGTLQTTDARRVAVAGDLVLVADGAGGLLAIDVSDPSYPSIRYRIPTIDAQDVAVQGTMAYVADGRGGLKVVALAAPGGPTLVATSEVDGARSVAASEPFVLVADGTSGIQVFDVSQVARPRKVAFIDAADARGVAVRGDFALVASSAGVQVARLQLRGVSREIASCMGLGKALHIALGPEIAVVSGHEQGITVLAAGDPLSVTDRSVVGTLKTDYAEAAFLDGGLVWVADGPAGLKIASLAPDGAPTLLGAFPIRGAASALVVRGGLAFVAARTGGLAIIDAKDPRAPMEVASYATGDARDVAIQGDLAFVADAREGLIIVNVADPSRPTRAGNLSSIPSRRVAISGTRAYLVAADGVAVVDISDPARPRLIGRFATLDAQAVAGVGDRLLLAEGIKGLRLFDVTDPERPRELSRCESIYAVGVAVRDDVAYVVDVDGVRIIQLLVPDWLIGSSLVAPD